MGNPAPKGRSSRTTIEVRTTITIDHHKIRRILAIVAAIAVLAATAKYGSVIMLFV